MTQGKNANHEENTEKAELEKLTYEAAVSELEHVVKQLETGDITLDESLRLFQKGMSLSDICHRKLEAIEKKITQLVGPEESPGREIPFGEDNDS